MFIFISILAVPSLSMIFLRSSSFSVGIAISIVNLIVFSIFLFGKKICNFKFPRYLLWILIGFSLFILLHFYIVNIFHLGLGEPNVPRFIGGYLFSLVILVAAFFMAIWLVHIKQVNKQINFTIIYIIILLCGLFGGLGFDLLNIQSSKPFFIFQEPSHFVIICAPIILYFYTVRPKQRMFLIILLLMLAYHVENLSLVVIALLCSLLTFKVSIKILLLISCFIALIFINVSNLDYFLSRLILDPEGGNISVLVLLQGWEVAIKSNIDSYGLGIGFQQMGFNSITGFISSRIEILNNNESLNLYDAGSTAPKLITEFGGVGVMIVILYVKTAFVAFKHLRATCLNNNYNIYSLEVLANCMIVSYSIELFIRGTGYFTSGTFFIISALIFLRINKYQS
jgi:hypothetical protein